MGASSSSISTFNSSWAAAGDAFTSSLGVVLAKGLSLDRNPRFSSSADKVVVCRDADADALYGVKVEVVRRVRRGALAIRVTSDRVCCILVCVVVFESRDG